MTKTDANHIDNFNVSKRSFTFNTFTQLGLMQASCEILEIHCPWNNIYFAYKDQNNSLSS